jgi:hypothetical protein
MYPLEALVQVRNRLVLDLLPTRFDCGSVLKLCVTVGGTSGGSRAPARSFARQNYFNSGGSAQTGV